MQQLRLITEDAKAEKTLKGNYRERLITLLSGDLDFHEKDSGYASHNLHSFPAKFPPQLPRKFIDGLTEPQDLVLDPMMGSGTTILEAYLTGRHALGFDIDPLAIMVSKVKTTPLDASYVIRAGNHVLHCAKEAVSKKATELKRILDKRWSKSSKKFINYWFAPRTQTELIALILEIDKVEQPDIRHFLRLVFSSIIITKMGGVSLALDLAHTRPHRAKVVLSRSGEVILEQDLSNVSPKRAKLLTKTLRSPLDEFGKRLQHNTKNILNAQIDRIKPNLSFGNAQNLALTDDSIDLIVTSPPYASNAIDYMRAHKFSLVWMGYPITELGNKRKEYIGGEAISDFSFENLPKITTDIVDKIAKLDQKKALVLHRYYSEMTRVLKEMYRVLKPGAAALVVVGSSTMRGEDTLTEKCLAEIGESIGFEVPKIGVHHLDRNRRMMPAGITVDHESQIQQRMHEEYVIGYYKPLRPQEEA
jgi:DNA modification methylase